LRFNKFQKLHDKVLTGIEVVKKLSQTHIQQPPQAKSTEFQLTADVEKNLFGEIQGDVKRDPVDNLMLFHLLALTPRDFYFLWKKHIGENDGLINYGRFFF
jgi:hypothetical protein